MIRLHKTTRVSLLLDAYPAKFHTLCATKINYTTADFGIVIAQGTDRYTQCV